MNWNFSRTAKAVVVVCCMQFAPLAASAAGAGVPLTLQDAIALALKNNPDLAIASHEIEVAQAQVLQGQTRPNPELAWDLEDTRYETRTQGVRLAYPFETGDKRAARIEAAERGRDTALAALDAKRVELRADVAAAFFEMLAAQERAGLAKMSIELARTSSDAVARRVAAGKVSPVEAHKARVAEASERVELARAWSELRNAHTRLAALLGADAPRFDLVAGSVDALPPLPDPDDLQQRLLASPALARARLEVARRKALVAVESSKRMPDVTVSVGVQRANELQRNQWLFGVSAPLPLFDRNRGNLLEARKREDIARGELLATSARLDSDVFQAHERLKAAREEIDILQNDALPAAQSAFEATTVGFEHGKFSFLEVLDAQRTLFAAKSRYISAQSEAHRAVADIVRLSPLCS